MMFVDESGDVGFPKNRNWSKFYGSTHFVRVGAIIHGWKWKAWNRRVLTFKKNNGLKWNDEIRASSIRKGKDAFKGWDLNRRDCFLQDLTQLIGTNLDITLIGVAIDKRRVIRKNARRLWKPEIVSLELLLERYNGFLKQQIDKAGIVVLDPTMENNDDNLRYFQDFIQNHSSHMRPRSIVESTFFAKSHTSNMIQIADVCSNVFYREQNNRNNHLEYQAILPRFMRSGKRLRGVGIKEWP